MTSKLVIVLCAINVASQYLICGSIPRCRMHFIIMSIVFFSQFGILNIVIGKMSELSVYYYHKLNLNDD